MRTASITSIFLLNNLEIKTTRIIASFTSQTKHLAYTWYTFSYEKA